MCRLNSEHDIYYSNGITFIIECIIQWCHCICGRKFAYAMKIEFHIRRTQMWALPCDKDITWRTLC